MYTQDKLENKIVMAFANAVGDYRLYGADHLHTIHTIEALYQQIQQALLEQPQITLDHIKQQWLFNGVLIVDLPGQVQALAQAYQRKNIARLMLKRGISLAELNRFIGALGRQDEQLPVPTDHIISAQVAQFKDEQQGDDIALKRTKTAEPISTSHWSYQQLQAIYYDALKHKTIDFKTGKNLAEAFIETFVKAASPLAYLADVKREDEYTFVHTINVALLTMSLAKRFGIKGQMLIDITYAALLHDVGKMLIPDKILNKEGKLTDDELSIMRTHPVLGAQQITCYDHMSKLTALVALEHHIRYDGQGYPKLGHQWRPHFVSQMVSVADVYDALRSRRPYREPLSHGKIVKIMLKDKGSALNPILVDAFLTMINSSDI